MRPRDWLLQLLDAGLDPIRIQKGMFLFAKQSGAPRSQVYSFEPYNWGPFSKAIYSDIDRLQEAGLVERVPVPGTTYAKYRLAPQGEEAAAVLRAKANPELVEHLDAAKHIVTHRSFNSLLDYVYKNYPDYAVNSIFEH